MSKRRKGRPIQRGEKSDFTLEEKLKKENKQLKREVRKLRNLVKRADFARIEHLENLVAEQREFDKTIKKNEKKAKEKWLCFECKKGYMMPRIFPRKDGDYYYRLCNSQSCDNRTKMKKLTKEVDLSLLEEK